MTDRQVHSALVRWIEGVAAVQTIKSHVGGAASATPYVVVNLLGVAEVRDHPGEFEFNEADGDVTAAAVVEMEWRFSLHAYGPEPTDILNPLRAAVHVAQAGEPLMPSIVIHDASQVRNVPDWINNRWEPRAQMDINLRGLTRHGFLVDTIEAASFDIGPKIELNPWMWITGVRRDGYVHFSKPI